jgi:hypothetical protein
MGSAPKCRYEQPGEATLTVDIGGEWTRLITERYVLGAGRDRSVFQRIADERVAIRLPADNLVAVASVQDADLPRRMRLGDEQGDDARGAHALQRVAELMRTRP